MFGRQRRQGPGLALFLLLLQMTQAGPIPPVTLATIVGQVVIFLRLFNIHWPSIGKVCISAVNVWYKEDVSRLFLATFFHLDEWHLYYNMVSFLFKGRTLEKTFGSVYFAFLIAVFAILSNTLTVGLAIVASHLLQDPSYLSQCAAGFSGVTFALKVVTTHYTPSGTQYIMGFIPVPSRYACWAELVVIQLLVPNASFLGHLAGILAGLLYVKGPLKDMMNVLVPPVPSYTYQARSTGYNSQHQTSNSRTPYNTRAQSQHYNNYTGGLSEEDQLAHAMRESRTSGNPRYPEPSAPPASDFASPTLPARGGLYPDLSQSQQEDVRQRRRAFYD